MKNAFAFVLFAICLVGLCCNFGCDYSALQAAKAYQDCNWWMALVSDCEDQPSCPFEQAWNSLFGS
jgi:hypothetical protein